MEGLLSTTVVFLLVIFGTLAAFAMRFKRCPSDKILVIYGKTSGGRSSRCIHGGAAFVWPMIQAYQFLDLTPIPIDIKLEGALSQQGVRHRHAGLLGERECRFVCAGSDASAAQV